MKIASYSQDTQSDGKQIQWSGIKSYFWLFLQKCYEFAQLLLPHKNGVDLLLPHLDVLGGGPDSYLSHR